MPAANVTLRVRATGARAAAADVNATTGAVKRLTAATAGASKGLMSAGRNMRSVGSSLTHGLTVPIIAVGGAAAKMSIDFDNAMTRIETSTGAPHGEIHRLRGQVLGLAKDSQYAPKELANTLFHAEALGYRGKKAMAMLREAVRGATIGHADLESTMSALGGVVRTNIKGTGSYRQAMAQLVSTAGAGNMTMDQLIEGLGTGVVASVKTAGLSLKDYTGALATFTDENIPASSASAQLATALHFLYAPTDKGNKALKSIGLSGRDMALDFNKPRGLLRALSDLKSHLGDLHSVRARQTLSQILPGGRGRILTTLLNQLDVYQLKMDQIARNQGKFKSSYKQQMEQPLTRLKTAWSSVQVALVQTGAAIVPIIVPLFEKIAHWVEKAANAFRHLSPSTKRWVIIGLGLIAVLGPLLSMLGIMVITIGALASPVVLIIAGIALLTAGVIYAYKKWGLFHDIVNAVWELMKATPGALKGAFQFIINWVIDRINFVIGLINKIGSVKIFGHRIGVHIDPIGHVDWTKHNPVNANASPIGGLGGASGDLGHGAAGAQVRNRQHVNEPRTSGSTDLPHGTDANTAAIHTHVHIDGREVARAVHRQGVKAKSAR